MMYPFMQLEDKTEIVHSEILEDNRVRVYIEKPVDGGFQSATCFLPEDEWESIVGFEKKEIEYLHEILESTAHLIIQFAREGGVENASNFKNRMRQGMDFPASTTTLGIS